MGCVMPGYRRFVTYLFRYENGKKGGNCGFAKVEVRQDKCRIELQAKGYGEKKILVYLFAGKEEKPEGAYLGELVMKNGMGNAVFVMETEAIGNTPYGINDMRGLYLKEDAKSFIASQWDDADTDWTAFVPYEENRDQKKDRMEPHAEEGTVGAEVIEEAADGDEIGDETSEESIALKVENAGRMEIAEDNKEEEAEEEIAVTTGEKETQPSTEETRDSKKQDSKPELHATQTALAAEEQPYLNAGAWEKQWQCFTAVHPAFHPFDEDEGVYGVKMNLRDFKILPKQYRYLANNSFLLHGYFNYKYILFGYMDGKEKHWFIGIPGNFQNQEQILAGAFGFPEFRTKQLTRQKTGEFGYWYRFLEL